MFVYIVRYTNLLFHFVSDEKEGIGYITEFDP